MIWVHSGIEVAQENTLFIVGDAAADGCEVITELLFCIRCCGHCRGNHLMSKVEHVGSRSLRLLLLQVALIAEVHVTFTIRQTLGVVIQR